tara:strand:+ start:414 stop:1328 length:915 start_codon:yes stop_codon:yes gene_type:complete
MKIENIKEVLFELGYTNIIENHKEYRTRPIYRDSDNNTVLSINKINGRFVDFARNISGSFDDLVKLSLNLKSIDDARSWLSKNSVAIAVDVVDKPEIRMPKTYPKELLSKLMPDHSYWVERGVTEYSVSEFKGGVSQRGKMYNRYVFPIFDAKNNIVGFAGRDLKPNDKRPKWKLIGDKSKWKYPLFLNYKLIKEQKSVIIVESIGDMLALWDCGIKNVVVSFGLDLTGALVGSFIRFDVSKIVIAFNDDSKNSGAGNRAAYKASKKLLKYFDPHQITVSLPSGGDFGDMSKEQIIDWMGKING